MDIPRRIVRSSGGWRAEPVAAGDDGEIPEFPTRAEALGWCHAHGFEPVEDDAGGVVIAPEHAGIGEDVDRR